ncbi:MAG TPA: hypothetical protein VFD22_03060 [Gemmatimonadaceae bacterium]|nr:hypothetical protein [Gemmatimonadaceae bacterium]
MSEEDRIDEILRSAASDYNRPPVTPRDEMWEAILAARSAPGPRLHVTAGGTPTGYTAQRRFGVKYAWIGMAAAAVLLIETGIGIGRYTSAPKHVADAPASLPKSTDEIGSEPSPVDSHQSPVDNRPTTDDSRPTTGDRSPATDDRRPATGDSRPATARTREQIRRDPQIRVIKPVQSPNRFAVNPAAPADSRIYNVAMVRHLADAEVLLTSFSVGSRDAAMNAQFAGWAKGLLSNTRLLLDSPAGDDPRRAKLLQDLEMVLAQIVQLAPDAKAEDRQLIEGSILEGHVMTRLRSAIPADSNGILERR